MKPQFPTESKEAGPLTNILAWLENHTRIVAFIATILIVVIVIVVINRFYSESRLVRAQRELKDAIDAKMQGNMDEAIDKLKGAKTNFGDTVIADQYSYMLANFYVEAGKFREAKEEYEWFFKNHPNSPFQERAVPAHQKLLNDINWLENEKPKLIASHTLYTDPFSQDGLAGSVNVASPVKLPSTKFDLETDKGNKLSFELFDNNAPNTTAHFVSLVNKNVYNGVKLYVSGDEKITPEVTLIESTLDYKLPLEQTAKTAERGTLVLSQGHTAEFSMLLKTVDSATVAYSSVFGKLTSGFDTISKIQSGETISKITLIEERDSYPEVQKVKK